jgi:hypothetical protein
VWALVLALVGLPLVGLFAWSCYQPVWIVNDNRGVGFGYTTHPFWSRSTTYWPHYGWGFIKLPGGRKTGWYVAGWLWMPSNP